MSRLDDIISLIQTTNEVYFITAPGRVKAAFILVDDVIELALKSYLQFQALERQARCLADIQVAGILNKWSQAKWAIIAHCEGRKSIDDLTRDLTFVNTSSGPVQLTTFLNSYDLPHWSIAGEERNFKRFHEVIEEVKTAFLPGSTAEQLLDEVLGRRVTRNKFFHDPNQSDLTVTDENCLRAFIDMFSLMEELFPQFRNELQTNRLYETVRCQISVIRLKLAEFGAAEITVRYNAALQRLRRTNKANPTPRSLEYNILHTVSDRFFAALHDEFTTEVQNLQNRISLKESKINKQPRDVADIEHNKRIIKVLLQQVNDLEALRGTP